MQNLSADCASPVYLSCSDLLVLPGQLKSSSERLHGHPIPCNTAATCQQADRGTLASALITHTAVSSKLPLFMETSASFSVGFATQAATIVVHEGKQVMPPASPEV